MTQKLRTPKLSSIRLTDPLFGGYAALVANSLIPYQWEILHDRVEGAEKSYCVRNFRIAAGDAQGDRKGAIFCDTDAYKWLEAVAYCIENGSGARFCGIADELIELIGCAQQSDGYLNTYYTLAQPEKRWTNLTEGHELYCAGHLIEAAVAYFNATGKRALLNIACRFSDHIYGVFCENGGRAGCPGHQEIELALVKLYGVTGEKRYLELARHFIDVRGDQPSYFLQEIASRNGELITPEFYNYDAEYAQSHKPPIEQLTAEGHAVRAMYMFSAMADLAAEYGDEKLKSTCETLWRDVTQRRMYITGAIGSSATLERFTADYDLPNDRMYGESCASIGLIMFSQRMAALTRDARYYDAVELALCNTVLSGIAETGDSYFYVNPLEVWPENCKPSTALEHIKPVRQKWFNVACCPTNIARTLASLGQYIYAEDDDALYINQFIGSEISFDLGCGMLNVSQTIDRANGFAARIVAENVSDKQTALFVRIPSYMKRPSLTKNGKAISPAVEKGYAALALAPCEKADFTISSSAAPEFVAANLNVRADAGKLALKYGPFVYCLEQQDNGENLNALSVSEKSEITLGKPLEGLRGALPTLNLYGERITNTLEDDALYGAPAFKYETVKLKAVPYFQWCSRTPGEMLVWLRANR